MADINPSAENVRAMLTETLGRLRKASEEYFGLLEKGLSSSPLPIADQAKQFCNFMQRNVTATFDLGDKLSQAKDMQDALKIQSEFFQDQMRSLTDQAKSMGESAMKAAHRGLYPKQIGKLRGGDDSMDPLPAGQQAKPVQAKGSARSAIFYFVAMRLT